MQLRRLLALSALAAFPLVAQPNRITVAIDAHRTTLVRGQVHPLARPQFDQGVVEDAFPLNNLSLTLGPSAEQQAALGSFLVSLQDPNSADYQKWLTPQEFADRFGPSPADYAQVAAWLEGEGFTIQTRVPSRNWIAFSGTAGQARRAFGADIHRYQVNGEPHFANANDPSVPEALAGLVAGFRGLHDFRLHPQHHTVHTAYTSGSGTHYLAPDDVATIYSVAGLYSRGFDGTGQKLVVAGQTDVNIADMENFRTMFGLPANDPQLMLVPGLPDPGISSSDIIEANLDLEWSGAVARKAAIFYVYSTNVLDAVQYAIAQNLAPVISLSYGGCEAGGGAQQLQLLAQQANALGITWVNSSGDSGAAGCDYNVAAASQGPAVDLPASIPEVTGVGGARFQEGGGTYWAPSNSATLASALSYIPETSWNDTALYGQLAASGGGPSGVFAKPAWQAGARVPPDGARDVPDVAMAASAMHDGAILCNGGSCANGISGVTTVVGGTSLGAPLFAGIVTLMNHYRVGTGAQPQPGLGNINPSLYALAQTSTDVFHDITTGNNIVPCTAGSVGCTTGSFGYSAGLGYDLVTGLGSVNAYNLAAEWRPYVPSTAALTSVSVSPPTVTAGTPATVTVNLSAGAPSGGALVTLATSNAAFPVPASITVLAGQSTASISVKAAGVTASTPATVTASYLSVSETANVTVAPPPPALKYLAVLPASMAGGAPAAVTIVLSSAAPTGGTTVTLSSTNPALPVPSSATVKAGSMTLGLVVRTLAVTVSTPVTVTATYAGVRLTANVTLTPAPTLSGVSVSPATVAGGGMATVTVTLSAPALTGGAPVTLQTTNTAFPVPSSVTVLAGQSTASINVQAAGVTASTAATVTATYLSASQTASVTVTPLNPPPTLSAVSVAPATITGGAMAALTVTLSGPAPAGGAQVTLQSTSAAFPVPPSVTVPVGQSTASINVQSATVTTPAAATVTATYLLVSQKANVTVTPPPPSLKTVVITPSSIEGGAQGFLTIVLAAAAPTGGVPVTLSTTNAAFPVPSAATVPAGSVAVELVLRTLPVTVSTPVTVTATAGAIRLTANTTLTPQFAPSLSAVSISPATLTGGGAANVVITLNGIALTGGASVTLESSSPAFPVPISAVVPAGLSSLVVRVQTSAVTASTPVTVTATYQSVTAKAAATLTP